MKIYHSYDISIKLPCCNQKVMVASYDYYLNALKTKKMLITVLGNERVFLKKVRN